MVRGSPNGGYVTYFMITAKGLVPVNVWFSLGASYGIGLAIDHNGDVALFHSSALQVGAGFGASVGGDVFADLSPNSTVHNLGKSIGGG